MVVVLEHGPVVAAPGGEERRQCDQEAAAAYPKR